MSTSVSWLLESDVQPGSEDVCKSLITEMVKDIEANEPGTLVYDISVNENGSVYHFYEAYKDSASAMTHLAAFGEKYAGRFLKVFTPTRFVTYGSPSAELKEALAAFSPIYMSSAAGFTR